MFQEFKDRSKQHWENQRRFRGGHGLRQAGKKGEKIPGRSSYLKESAEEGKSLSTQWGGCAPNPPCPAQGEVEQTHRGHRGGGCQSNGAVPGNLWDPSCQAAGQPLAVGRKGEEPGVNIQGNNDGSLAESRRSQRRNLAGKDTAAGKGAPEGDDPAASVGLGSQRTCLHGNRRRLWISVLQRSR